MGKKTEKMEKKMGIKSGNKKGKMGKNWEENKKKWEKMGGEGKKMGEKGKSKKKTEKLEK